MRKKNGITKRAWACSIAILLTIALLFGGCGASSGASAQKDGALYAGTADTEEAMASDAAYDTAEVSGGENVSIDPAKLSQKLVYSGSLTIQTLNYDETVKTLKDQAADFNAIVESETESDDDYYWYDTERSSGSSRTLYIRVRVPSERFYEFIDTLSGDGKVTSKSTNVENISRTYADTQISVDTLEEELARLQEMMGAAETIEEMVQVESRLTEVETELNQKKTELAGMDTDVEYSTLDVTVSEVVEYTADEETPYGERIVRAFEKSWTGFFAFLKGTLIVLITLLPFIILVVVIIAVIRAIRKRRGGGRTGRTGRTGRGHSGSNNGPANGNGNDPVNRPMNGPMNSPVNGPANGAGIGNGNGPVNGPVNGQNRH